MKSCPSSLRKMRGRDVRDRLRVGDGVSFMVCGIWFGLFQEFWMFGNVRVEYRSNFTQNDSSVRNVGYFLTFSRTRETQHSWRTVSR